MHNNSDSFAEIKVLDFLINVYRSLLIGKYINAISQFKVMNIYFLI